MEHMEHQGHDMQGEDHSMHAAAESDKEIKSKLNKVIAGSIGSAVILLMDFFIDIPSEGMIALLIALGVLIYTGHEFYVRGIPIFLKRGRPNMDTLVALGGSTAFIYSS